MTYDSARHVMVLFGGTDGRSFFADTWERQGSDWSQRTPKVSPPGRGGAAMTFDSARGVTVLFGGQNGGGGSGAASFLGDVWEWDGATWTQRATAVAPPPRYYSPMVFDASRRATVLFGGSDRGQSSFNQTWEWDGTNWALFPPAIGPSARADAFLVYDPTRGASLLFSGNDGSFPADTWERNGTRWELMHPAASPPGRGGGAMAFDAARGVAVLFGGAHGPMTPPLADTWEWNGTTWIERTPPITPAARTAFAMAYDPDRAVSVIFGGAGETHPLDDTWEWNGTAWSLA